MSFMNSKRALSASALALLAVAAWCFGAAASAQSRNERHRSLTAHGYESFKLVSMGLSISSDCREPSILTAKTITPECVPLGYRVYEAVDGSRANLTHGKFNSPNIATTRLQAWMKLANRIIKNEKRRDAAGNVIGQRIIVSFDDKDKSQDYFQVGWTDGRDCYLIGSTSLSTALSLEAWIGIPVALRR